MMWTQVLEKRDDALLNAECVDVVNWRQELARRRWSRGKHKDSWKLPERQIGVKTHFDQGGGAFNGDPTVRSVISNI